MQVRRIPAAAAAVLLMGGCSDADDTATAEETAPPAATATAVHTPSPLPTATTATSPAVVFELRGRSLGDQRVVVVKTFWTGATASAITGNVVPEVRATSTRATQRALATEIDSASRKGWALPPRPIGVVTGVSGSRRTGTVTICLWSPSVSWIEKDSGNHVESVRKRWLEYEFDVRDGKVGAYARVNTCRRAAP